MMIRAAGGPGLISPIDFNERKPRLNRNTWIAIGVVALAHVGVGIAVYYQRFELKTVIQPEQPLPPMRIDMVTLPKVIEPEPTQAPRPVPPNAPIHQSPTPVIPTETFVAIPGDAPTNSTTITIAVPTPVPVENVAPARPEPRPPAVITQPRWASQPNAAQMSRAYPSQALANGVPGSASLNCLVSAAGTLSNCTVTSQTPASAGFGRAADSLTRYFRMSPGMVDGQPIDGARVSFTVRFAVND